MAIGKAGTDIAADAESLGRMLSLLLRTTAPPNRREMMKLIIEQLQDIGGARPIGFGPKRVLSLPDAVARVLQEEVFPEDPPQQLGLPIASSPGATPALAVSGATTKDLVIPGADMCPECNMITLVRAEGCRKCAYCGYSEC